MRLDLEIDEVFPNPIGAVWRAITDRRVLARWLMENDFEARVGARFVLRRNDPPPGWRGWVDCEVLEIQEPTRMVWSWSDSDEESEPTRVIFELRTEGRGTRLKVRHVGEVRDSSAKLIRERWRIKLGALASVLGRNE